MQFFLAMKPPRTTHQTKAVRIIRGKPVFYEPAALKEARSKLSSALAPHRPEAPMSGALRVVVKWCFETKSKKQHGTYKPTRPDAHNLNKLLFDVMTDLHFWVDDAQVTSETIEKFWLTTPGIFISVEEIDEKGERT